MDVGYSVCMSMCLSVIQRHPLIPRVAVTELRLTPAIAPAAAGAAGADDKGSEKIDWHDYTQIAQDEQRTGRYLSITTSSRDLRSLSRTRLLNGT